MSSPEPRAWQDEFLRLVTGLDRPTAGRVVTLDTDLATLDRDGLAVFRAARIGLVDQVRDLVPFLSALENVELGMAIRGRSGPDVGSGPRPRSTGLASATTRPGRPRGLSVGERFRDALARALATEPELLVLTNRRGARSGGARSVAELLHGLDEGDVTMIATNHDPALIAAASDRLDLEALRVTAGTQR